LLLFLRLKGELNQKMHRSGLDGGQIQFVLKTEKYPGRLGYQNQNRKDFNNFCAKIH